MAPAFHIERRYYLSLPSPVFPALLAQNTFAVSDGGVGTSVRAESDGLGGTEIVGISPGSFTATQGRDIIAFAYGTGPNTVNATASTITSGDQFFGNGFDNFSLSGGGTFDLGNHVLNGFYEFLLDNNSYNITTGDANVADGQKLVVDATALDSSHTFVFNGSAETNGSFVVKGGAGINTIIGGARNDTLQGGASNDRLNGGGGADVMTGGTGNDFYVDNAADQAIEAANGGTERVFTSVSYTLGATQSIELFSTTNNVGTAAINLTGNALAQQILGNDGNNIISDGGGAADTMTGRGGNDTFTVNNTHDRVIEAANGGADRVNTNGSYALGAGQSIELLATTNPASTTALALYGNELAQQIAGNNGGDLIRGGGGNDVLTGGAGHDSFVFDTTPNTSTNDPTITDFTVSGVNSDLIDLSHAIYNALPTGALAASAFHVGTAATNAIQHIIYNSGTSALLYDADGSGAGAAVQFAKLSTGLAMTASQFQVIA